MLLCLPSYPHSLPRWLACSQTTTTTQGPSDLPVPEKGGCLLSPLAPLLPPFATNGRPSSWAWNGLHHKKKHRRRGRQGGKGLFAGITEPVWSRGCSNMVTGKPLGLGPAPTPSQLQAFTRPYKAEAAGYPSPRVGTQPQPCSLTAPGRVVSPSSSLVLWQEAKKHLWPREWFQSRQI